METKGRRQSKRVRDVSNPFSDDAYIHDRETDQHNKGYSSPVLKNKRPVSEQKYKANFRDNPGAMKSLRGNTGWYNSQVTPGKFDYNYKSKKEK